LEWYAPTQMKTPLASTNVVAIDIMDDYLDLRVRITVREMNKIRAMYPKCRGLNTTTPAIVCQALFGIEVPCLYD